MTAEVIVYNPRYWSSQLALVHQLAQILSTNRSMPIGEPTESTSPENLFTIVQPAYWAAQLHELQDALRIASGMPEQTGQAPGDAAGAVTQGQERLTLTVEEAATILGISRAFAYESVRRGDIPHIKLGRRLLIPRAALNRLLDSASPDTSPEAPETE